MNTIAFFDFDGTLTRHDTFIDFAIFSVGKRAFINAFVKSIPSLCLWKLGLKSNSYAKQTLFSNLYKGMTYSCFKELGNSFIKKIDKDKREDVFEILNRHKRNGDTIIIVSASIGDWIRPWAVSNGIDKVLATEVEVDAAGKLTGKFLTANCHGKEKALRIQQLYPRIADFETWAYGDSSGDIEMLAIVSHPFHV